jgi:circadian clock protein KaiC
VIKKRGSSHEDTIREYRIAGPGLQIGPPLEEFHGVLRGMPRYLGQNTLLK